MAGRAFLAACVQLRTGRDIAANIQHASTLIREAASHGAELVATPETTSFMELGAKRLFALALPEEEDPALRAFRALAAELDIWLLIGSLAVQVAARKAANRSFLLSPRGNIAARYDKIHMFDVDLPGAERYRESANYRPGGQAVLADLPWGKLGLSICYDLRFPGLYRTLARGGASFLAVPSAFTQKTGEAHWHILLRARAIEAGCFVLAPAQGGTHENGRETYGHSMIVGPWGNILAEAAEKPGYIMAELDPAAVVIAREQIPVLAHERSFLEPPRVPGI